jgi:hypothetical protein
MILRRRRRITQTFIGSLVAGRSKRWRSIRYLLTDSIEAEGEREETEGQPERESFSTQ